MLLLVVQPAVGLAPEEGAAVTAKAVPVQYSPDIGEGITESASVTVVELTLTE